MLVCGLSSAQESPLPRAILKGNRYRRYGLPGLPAVDFAVKTTRFMLCIESSPDNKMFADAYKAALPHPDPKSESGVSAWASFAR